MSQLQQSASIRPESGRTVAVPTPAPGAEISVQSSPAGELAFEFDPSQATASRDGNNLIFTLDNGGTAIITDFFVVGDESLPALKLPDGIVVAGLDFFAGSDMDLATAAGPSAGGTAGSGSGEYSDDPGSLIDGIARLGSLGTDHWGRETEVIPEYTDLREGADADPEGAGVVVPPVEPENPPVEPENPPIEPENPPIEPENPPIEPENPPIEPENPPVEPENPPVEPENPPVEPETPSVIFGDPVTVHESMLEGGTGLASGDVTPSLTGQSHFTVQDAESITIEVSGIGLENTRVSKDIPLADLAGVSEDAPYEVGGGMLITGYDPESGDVTYTYTLQGREDHAKTQGHNTEVVSEAPTITVAASNASEGTSSGSVSQAVTVVDDTVRASEVSIHVNESTVHDYVITLVLDCSGSMYYEIGQSGNDKSSTTGHRMEVAKAALIDLIEAYEGLGGTVQFNLVTFGTTASASPDHILMTAGEAKAAVNGISNDFSEMSTGNDTHYSDGMEAAQKVITEALDQLNGTGGEQIVYFISDGKPTDKYTANDFVSADGNKGSDEWRDWVNEKGIDVIPVGIVADSYQKDLGLVGNSGLSQEVILVTDDAGSLVNALLNTVPTTIHGNLVEQANVLGADEPLLQELILDGEVFKFTDENGNPIKQTIILDAENNVTMEIEANGDYYVTVGGKVGVPPAGISVNDITFTVVDKDGDASTGTIFKLTIHDTAPEAYDNIATVVKYAAVTQVGKHTLNYDKGSPEENEAAAMADGWTKTGGEWTFDERVDMGSGNYLLSEGEGMTRGIKLLATGDGGNGSSLADIEASLGVSLESLGLNLEGFTDGALISNTYTLTSTVNTIKFNYSMHGGQDGSDYDNDQFFWVIKDEAGNVVDSGVVRQNTSDKLGDPAATISSNFLGAGEYTLYFGVLDAGGTNGDAWVYIDDVVTNKLTKPTLFKGNYLTDASPDGMVDQVLDNAAVTSITFNGETRDFADAGNGLGAIIFDLAGGGKAYFFANGTYEVSTDGNLKNLRFTYELTDQDGDTSSASLMVNPTVQSKNYTGTDGDDFIVGNDSGLALSGGSGNDTIYGGDGKDTLSGGSGNDSLHGGDGNDTLYGGSGNDILYGGDGDDILYGGTGNDILVGGAGADIFAWQKGDAGGGATDTILDFNLSEGDRIQLSDLIGEKQEVSLDVLFSKDALKVGVGDQNLTLTLTADGGTQTIEVNFESEMNFDGKHFESYTDFYTEYNNSDASTQNTLLAELIKSMS